MIHCAVKEVQERNGYSILPGKAALRLNDCHRRPLLGHPLHRTEAYNLRGSIYLLPGKIEMMITPRGMHLHPHNFR